METWRKKLRERYMPKGSFLVQEDYSESEGGDRTPAKYDWRQTRKPVFETAKSSPLRYAWASKITDTKPPRSELQEVIHEQKTEDKKREVVQETLNAVKVIKGKHKVL